MNREDLFNLYLTGGLTPAQRVELERLLRGDDDARREFLDYVMETGMIVRVGNRLLAAAHDARLDLVDVAVAASGARVGRRWGRYFMGIAAALLVLAAGWQVARYIQSIAVLQNVTGRVLLAYGAKSVPARNGMRIFSNVDIATVDGDSLATIAWKDGSSIRLPGYSQMRLAERAGQKIVELHKGYFEGQFQPQAVSRPVILSGPHMSAEVLGTVVRMDAKSDTTKLAVVQGKVRVRREADGRSVQVTTRQEVAAGDDAGDLAIRRFFWADRFVGGACGTNDSVRTHNCDAVRRIIEKRFKGSGGCGYGEVRGE